MINIKIDPLYAQHQRYKARSKIKGRSSVQWRFLCNEYIKKTDNGTYKKYHCEMLSQSNGSRTAKKYMETHSRVKEILSSYCVFDIFRKYRK